MEITFDQAKRLKTLNERGLDFADSSKVFEGPHLTIEDDRADYGETRFFTVGWLNQRLVVIVWTERGNCMRIISMRKANEREQRAFAPRLGNT